MKVLTTLIFIALLPGCTFQKLAVGQLDTLLEMQTAPRLDLYRPQRQELARDIDRLLLQQKSRGPALQALLNRIDPARPQLFTEQWNELSAHYKAIAGAYTALLVRYLSVLDKKQGQHFIDKVLQENRELQKKAPQPVQQWRERLDYFFGELTEQQEKTLLANELLLKERWRKRLAMRLQLQQRLIDILQGSLFNTEKERQLTVAFAEYQQAMAQGQEDLIKLLQDLCRRLTAQQREIFAERKIDLQALITHYLNTDYH